MQITVHCFAQLREFFDPETRIELVFGATVQAACTRLMENVPPSLRSGAAALIATSRVSVDDEFVGRDFLLQEGSQLYLLPPSSGG